MSLVLATSIRRLNSICFRVSNHLPIIWREFKKMDKETNTEKILEPAGKKAKIMPSETSLNSSNTENGHSKHNDRVLMFHKLSEFATTPSRGSDHAVGFDLYSAHDCEIPAQGKAIVATDIQIMLPEGCYGRVAPRSGLAAKSHIDVGAGVIDRDYRGPVGVVLFNHAQQIFTVKRGDRVAQLICEKAFIPEIVESTDVLPGTKRGEAGFGSTGGHKSVEKDATVEIKKDVGASGDCKQTEVKAD
ncbi:deoxyuridine 5'-triphosphate nucleotidohydrolase-like [Lineus longissimus]|uniref:deoxyuridine 5'-triphosphate nucleotidohydrolase-like n=1 Tax=Lineus longissimus TaxID=88925 RepID=UPI00315D4B66